MYQGIFTICITFNVVSQLEPDFNEHLFNFIDHPGLFCAVDGDFHFNIKA